MLKAVI